MKLLGRIASLGGIVLLAVAVSGCVIRPWGYGRGHHDHGDRYESDRGSDRGPDQKDRNGNDGGRRGR